MQENKIWIEEKIFLCYNISYCVRDRYRPESFFKGRTGGGTHPEEDDKEGVPKPNRHKKYMFSISFTEGIGSKQNVSCRAAFHDRPHKDKKRRGSYDETDGNQREKGDRIGYEIRYGGAS